jgi:hypothetical protein
MDTTNEFIMDFQDHLAPKLDTYEQAIYLYIYRHSRLIGKSEVVIGFKSARARMASGIGEKGKPMSENTAYVKLASLAEKGCVEILDTERSGRRIRLNLPNEIPGIIPSKTKMPQPNIDELDFFHDEKNRLLILDRENHQCFYCLREVNENNHVIEHVTSRPEGNNGYRNVVAACRECNNRKGNTPVEDFVRELYRGGFLTAEDLKDRIQKLEQLRRGDLKPILAG